MNGSGRSLARSPLRLASSSIRLASSSMRLVSSLLAVALCVMLLVAIPPPAPASAALGSQTPDASSPLVAVLRGPGGIGHWIVTADGKVEVIGTAVVPSLDEAPPNRRVVGARIGAPGALGIWLQLDDGREVPVGDPGPDVDISGERPPGWLIGVSTRHLMSGVWWPDIDTACTAELPSYVRVGQTIMASLTERNFGAAVAQARNHQVGGILLEGGATPHIWRRIDELQTLSGWIPLLFAVDEEGGSVQRLSGVLPRLKAAARQVERTPEQVTASARQHALKMLELGFNINLAPVLDVGSGPGIGTRSFSDDPAVVTEYGVATVKGIADGGVLPVVKHFPGHGGASADTHRELATTSPLAELLNRDLAPFTAVVGNDNAAVMIGHLVVPGLTAGLPATLSPAAVNGLLREQLGHSGLVLTDSLTMQAIAQRWTPAQAATLALAAGADLLLVGGLGEAEAAYRAITEAVVDGRVSLERLNQAATNVLRAKGVYACSLVGRVN